MADLTRFDFHAKKFYFSEDVQVMSAEEVGQYLLLLVAAWLGGKDTSLPDNAVLLARMARVNKVSELVLAKFPVVETEYGPRRRNDTLYGEWKAANLRVQLGKENANKRWGNTTEDGTPIAPQKTATGLPVPKPVQAMPLQAMPTRARVESSSPSQAEQPEEKATAASDLGLTAPDPAQAIDFKTFRHEWQNVTKIALGRDKRTVEKYEEACRTFGAGKVHFGLSKWATVRTLDWVKEHAIREPFSLFLKQLEATLERASDDKTCDSAMIEASMKVERVPDVITSPEVLKTVDDVVARLAADEQKRRLERAARAKAAESESDEDRAIIDVDNFLG